MTKILGTFLLFFLMTPGLSLVAQTAQRVYDLNPTSGSSSPQNLTSFKGTLYFSADDGNVGRELWRYDQNSSAPALVADIASGRVHGFRSGMPELNGRMYFNAYIPAALKTQLVVYDGVNPPTVAPGIPDSIYLGTSDLITYNGKIFFSAGTASTGTELCSYDGAGNPTLYDINPDTGSNPHYFTIFNGKLYFLATGDYSNFGEELYVYDPATDQCSMVADINPGGPSSHCRGFTVAGSKMYFAAITPGYEMELCAFDGNMVTRLSDLAPGPQHGVTNVLAYYRGDIIFRGSTDNIESFPYKYNVTTGQIDRLSNDPTITEIFAAAEYKGTLYLSCGKDESQVFGTGNELWKFDGASLSMLPEISPGWRGSYPANFLVHNDNLYFTARDSAYGVELYRLNDATRILRSNFEGDLTLFPNPATTTATVELTLPASQALALSFTDIMGREVFKTGLRSFDNGKTRIVIPLHTLASGSYNYRLVDAVGQLQVSGILVRD